MDQRSSSYIAMRSTIRTLQRLGFNAWMSCIRPGGVCLIEHTLKRGPEEAKESDPFKAELWVMPYLITRWGRSLRLQRNIVRPRTT